MNESIKEPDDYLEMLSDMSVTDQHLRELSEREEDRIDIDLNLVSIKNSEIEGKGVFANNDVSIDEEIGIANIYEKRTQLGRYTNHSGNPNAIPKIKVDKLIFVAIKNISSGDEITVDYRETRKISLRLQARLKINKLCAGIESTKGHLTSDDFPLNHYFSDGVYVREFFMEKGSVVIGKIHRHDHIAMLIQGSAKVFSEEGDVEMKSPHIWNSKAGERRAVYAHENCIFVTIHPTNETDLDKIEEQVIAPNYEVLESEL